MVFSRRITWPKVARKKVKSNNYGPRWEFQQKLCKRQANYRCEGCGWVPRSRYERRYLHAHHRISRNQGGTDTQDNLICLCEKCHQKEHPHMSYLSRQPTRIGNRVYE